MTDPVTAMTASTILVPFVKLRGFAKTSLAFQEFVKSETGGLAKRSTGEAIVVGFDSAQPNRWLRPIGILLSRNHLILTTCALAECFVDYRIIYCAQ